MSIKFTKLPKTTFSGLEYQNIIEDIIALVKENPEYNEQYDDFLSSNAGRMLIELFAYITDQLATRIDWVVNENFLSTATQKSSIIKILKLIGYSFDLPVAAEVKVKVSPAGSAINYYFTREYDISSNETYLPFYLTAEDKNGEKKTFELLNKDENTGKINYNNASQIESKEFSFFEGKTHIEDFFVETDNNQIFTLSNSPVIKESVQVYRITGDISEELMLVDSFLAPEAQNATSSPVGEEVEEGSEDINNISYKINIEDNNVVEIEFPSSNIIKDSSRRPDINDHIRIFYRVGGGINGNITPQSIKTTKKIPVYDAEGVQEGVFPVAFTNYSYGFGGKNEESIESAVTKAPSEIQTAKKTVTEEDYNTMITTFDEIMLSRSIGNSNAIAYSDALYDKYGKYINPLEVWNFILMNKEGWEGLSPSEYNDFSWFEKRLDNRFNEENHFVNGEDNVEVSLTEESLSATYRDTFVETTGGSTGYIIDSSKTFDNSYLGNTVTITSISENENNIGETRRIIGGAGSQFNLDSSLPENTTVNDEYTINYSNGSIIESDSLFTENTSEATFNCKITQVPITEYYFSSISDILEFSGTTNTLTNTDTELIEEVYPIVISKKSIGSSIILDSTLSLTVNGTTETITFSGSKTASEIVNLINSNNFEVGSILRTATGETFQIQGDTIKNSSEIRNISYNIYNLKKGMSISGATITEVHLLDKYIVLDNVMNTTENQKIFTVNDANNNANYEIAKVETNSTGTYIILQSPSKGLSSLITLEGAQAINDLFGINVTDKTFIKGVERTFIDNDKNLVYIHNSSFLHETNKRMYLQYIVDNKSEIIIGTKFSDLLETDPKYKEQADRIYSTTYNEQVKEIDYFNSSFDIRFTKDYNYSPSLYSIENAWSLQQNSFPEVESNSLTFPVTEKSLEITLDEFVAFSIDVTGSSLEELCANINNQIKSNTNLSGIYSVFDYAVPNSSNTFVLRSPTNFSSSQISVEENTTNVLFTGIASDIPTGDYYIRVVNDEIKLVKTSSNIPDFKFYTHFIFDQRYVEGIYDGLLGRKGKKLLTIDEDIIDYKLSPYKITGLENVYKQPIFKVFDLVGTVTYSKVFSKATIERNVKNILEQNYSLENSLIGRSIFKSNIASLIQSVDGVLYSTIEYLGLNKTNSSTNVDNVIEADFDEILLLGKDNGRGINLTFKSE